jgi:hypothetical protein
MVMEQHSAMAKEVAAKEGAVGAEVNKVQDMQQEEAGEDARVGEVDDRRLVIHDRGVDEALEGEEEEFVFGEEDSEECLLKGYFAVARYCSSHSFAVKVLFSDLFGIWGDGTTRDLGNNRYLLEFSTENSLSFAIRGGPWSFRGDAIIMVQYDGLSKLSEVVIESIPLWIRICDIPVAMMTNAFVSALGAKVGRVMEVSEAVKDFKRVHVDFALSDALMTHVSMKVRGQDLMEFVVKYENVPHFCFFCGHIGHAERECPDEDLYEDGERFGVELRASPFKRGAFRVLSFQATAPPAKRGLNFSGEQKDRVFSHSSSSSLNANHQGQTAQGRGSSAEQRNGTNVAAGVGNSVKVSISKADADGLSQGVQKMALGKRPRTANSSAASHGSGAGRETQRVSGLDSYGGSSEASLESGLQKQASVQDRLRSAKAKVLGPQQECKQAVQNSSAAKDTAKSKRNKKVLSPELIAQSFVGLQQDKEREGGKSCRPVTYICRNGR